MANSSYTPLNNNDKQRMRLSVDYRYQCEGEDITLKCLEPKRFTWDEIYEGWECNELKYYWKNKDINIVPWQEMNTLPEDHLLNAIQKEIKYEKLRDKRHKKNKFKKNKRDL